MTGSKTIRTARRPWLGGSTEGGSAPNTARVAPSRGRLATALGIAAVSAALLGAPSQAAAQVTVEIVPTSATATPGGTGTFDVDLVNNTASTVNVGGWQVQLSVPAGSVATFTASVASGFAGGVTYIFGTEQLPPPLGAPLPSKNFIALDVDLTASGSVPIAPGATVGLEHVTFSVASGAIPGTVVPVIDSGAGTVISDVNGGAIPIATLNGTIAVIGATSVPEPSSLLLAGVAIAAAGVASRFRKPRG
jgi:PEP-CTERM motif